MLREGEAITEQRLGHTLTLLLLLLLRGSRMANSTLTAQTKQTKKQNQTITQHKYDLFKKRIQLLS